MAPFPWDNEQEAVDALRESSAPAAATGGAGDWMTALPMLLGAGASIASPNMANAGNAVMQMGDYFRRQRMEDLSQQRYQQAVDVANRRAAADAAKQQAAQAAGAGTAQYLQGLGFTPPAGVTDPNVLARLFEVWQRQQQWKAEQDRPRQERIAQLAPSLMTQYQTTEPAPEPMVKQADVQAWQPYAQHPATPLVQELVARGMPPTAENLAQFYGQDAVRNMPGGPKYGQERAAAFANQPGGYAYEKDRSTAELSIAIDALARAGVPMDKIPQILLTRGGLQNPRPGGETPEGIRLQAQGVPPGTLASRPDAAQIAQRVLDTDLARAIALETAKADALRPGQVAQAAATVQATGEAKRREPMAAADLSDYMHVKTFAAPPKGTTREQIDRDPNYIPKPKNFKSDAAAAVVGNLKSQLKIVLTRPDLYPISTGYALYDFGAVQVAGRTWALRAKSDPVLGEINSNRTGMAASAQFSGDTANIGLLEQVRQEAGLAMEPATRENALGALLRSIQRVNTVFASHGLAPMAVPPDLLEKAQAALAADRKRRGLPAEAPSGGDPLQPLLDAATGKH